MSYPRRIHTLIVEDESSVVANYRDIFSRLRREYDLEAPQFAQSLEDAMDVLSSPTIIHLLVLDLGLPVETRGQAATGVDPGVAVLDKAVERDAYPIPAVVVVSGRLAAANLTEMRSRLAAGFLYGEMVNKGYDYEQSELAKAIEAAQRYCDVGVHVHDSAGQLCPTVSPREEDMLRRCVLEMGHIGLDVSWWGDYQPASVHGDPEEMSKVLAGRIVMSDGLGLSRTTFFKFKESSGAESSHRDAEIMAQKLGHVKVIHSAISTSRSVLVTQKVGESETPPISLTSFLCRDPDQTRDHIPTIVGDICSQLDQLGSDPVVEVAVKDLFWPHHDPERIRGVLEAHADLMMELPVSPLTVLEEMRSRDATAFVRYRHCSHGDLNPTNIALDAVGDLVRAFIFDAEGTRRAPAAWDLAVLEVTAQLHQGAAGATLAEACRDFYGEWVTPPPRACPMIRPQSLWRGTCDAFLRRCEGVRYALKMKPFTP